MDHREPEPEREERGVTAIEYGMIVGVVGLAIIAALSIIGWALSSDFGVIQTTLDAAP